MKVKHSKKRNTCPEHGVKLKRVGGFLNERYECPFIGCTVRRGPGVTSTPCDTKTKLLRNRCHKLFDPLWQTEGRFATRNGAYRRLAAILGMPIHECHFGMFDADQCRAALQAIKTLSARLAESGE